jgi:sugar lactone lactonase YvrE
MKLATAGTMALFLTGTTAHAGTVPGVVAESSAKIVPSAFTNPTSVAIDPTGNIWIADTSGKVWEVAAGTTTAVQLYPTVPANSTIGLGGNSAIAIDAAGDIIVGGSYSTNGVLLFKNTSGVVSPVPTYIGSNSNLGGIDGYYASWRGVAVVNGTQVYAGVSYANSGNSTAIFTFPTSGVGGSKFLASLPGGIAANSMAGDNQSHLYYSDGVGVYTVNTASTTPTPVQLTLPGVKTPGGVSTDAQGNLYVTDTANSRIIKVPNEGGSLNPADEYEVVANVYDAYAVGIDALGNQYYTDDYNTESLFKVTEGGALFAATAIGSSSASVTTNFIFNASTTPTAIGYYQGTGAAKEFVSAGGSCAANTTYTALTYCTVLATFKPALAGARTGSVELLASSKAVGTAYLSGIGNGAAVTIDPGTQTTLTGLVTPATSYNSPSAAAFDAAGNLYVADAALNTVLVTPAGGTAATISLSKQLPFALNAPGGVTVDAAGNVFIADTGNSRIVEIPNESGALNPADVVAITTTPVAVTGYAVTGTASPYTVAFTTNNSFAVGQTVVVAGLTTTSGKLLNATFVVTAATTTSFSASTVVAPVAQTTDSGLAAVNAVLKSPTGIRASLDGSVYVVDSGDTRVLRFATYDGLAAVITTTLGSGFTAPAGITTDFLGNVYVSDAGATAGAGTVRSFSPLTNIGTPLLSQLSNPRALAVDAAGDVYYVSGGNNTVQMVPDIAGALAAGSKLALGSGLVTPTGLAIDASGNVVIADGGASTAYKLARTAGAVNFGNVNIGLMSTAQQATVTSAGNLPLTLGNPYAVLSGNTVDFQQQAPATECTSSASLATGTNCVVSVIFAPAAINALSETYTFSSNATNATTPTAVFSGFATNLSLTNTTLTMTPTAPSFGQTITVTASVAATRTGYTPTGTVTFYLDSNKAGTSNVVNGTNNLASFAFSLAAGNQISAGQHTICASYNGDMNNAASTSAQCLNFTVTKSTVGVGLTVLPTTSVSPGSTLYFSVVVTPPVAYAPTGTVSLYAVSGSTSTLLGSSATSNPNPGTLQASGVNGTAQIAIVTSTVTGAGLLSLGQYQIVAVYSGDGNFLTNTSSAVSSSVRAVGYTVSFSNTNLTVAQGNSVSTTIKITTIGGYGGDTYTAASGSTAAIISSELVDYICSTLPANTNCRFSPGTQFVNSYNSNDQCAVVSPPDSNGVSHCFFNTYTGVCTASPLLPSGQYAAGTGIYCSDPNFQNSYTVTLTINTNVAPVSSAGFGGRLLWPLTALTLALLGWMVRRRQELRRAATTMLTLTLMLCVLLSTGGCGGNTSPFVSPTGTTNFTVTFIGQNPAGISLTGGAQNTNVGAATISQFSLTNNVLTAQTTALAVPVTDIAVGQVALFSGMGYTTAVTTTPTGGTGTTVTTATTFPALDNASPLQVALINPGVTAVPLAGGATAVLFSINLTAANVPLVAPSTTTMTTSGGIVTTVITPTGSAKITLPNLVETYPLTLTITN